MDNSTNPKDEVKTVASVYRVVSDKQSWVELLVNTTRNLLDKIVTRHKQAMANVSDKMNTLFDLVNNTIMSIPELGCDRSSYMRGIRDYYEAMDRFYCPDEMFSDENSTFVIDGQELCTVPRESRSLFINLLSRGISDMLRDYKNIADYYIGKLQDFLIRKDSVRDKNYYIIYAIIDYYFGNISVDEALEDVKYAVNKAK